MQQGYSLYQMELLNWGNFHHWQKINLTSGENTLGPLLDGTQNSLIAGINGSGKSTLIDGIMVVLLPFERKTHLGVTHDYESGAGGGRSIKDYILGKFSATSKDSDSEGQEIYSRESGISALVLKLKHNQTQKIVTLGRIWWYSHFKIKNDPLFFIAHKLLSIGEKNTNNLLDQDGQLYKSSRLFRNGMAQRNLSLQIFDKASAYFQSLSHIFGDVTKDDLRLLNKAFYIKSVSQIDSFIRHHMLIEGSRESLDRLIVHVDEASEISRQIELCQTKLQKTEKIVACLLTYQKHHEEKKELKWQNQVAQCYPSWFQKQLALECIEKATLKVTQIKEKLPDLEQEFKQTEQELERLQALKLNNEVSSTIRHLELEKQQKANALSDLTTKQQQFIKQCVTAQIKFPKNQSQCHEFFLELKNKTNELQESLHLLDQTRTTQNLLKQKTHDKIKELKEDLEFISQNKTMIPRVLYQIKEECQKSLKLPPQSLVFVGELIDIKKEHQTKYTRAVEATLSPISRNLLCLPKYTTKVTKWINKTGLVKSIIIKRIKEEELHIQYRQSYAENSILDKIIVRNKEENPFYDYLWNWLCAKFYHRIVDVSEFDNQVEKAVTVEGMVKINKRTLKKFKEKLTYSLGWDTQNKQREIATKINELSQEHHHIEIELQNLSNQIKTTHQQQIALSLLESLDQKIFKIPQIKSELQEIDHKINKLKKENLDYQKLCESVDSQRALVRTISDQIATYRADIQTQKDKIAEADKKTASINKELTEYIKRLANDASVKEELMKETVVKNLHQLHNELSSRNKSHTEHMYKLQDRLTLLEEKLKNSEVRPLMQNYEKDHHDPNLHYTIEYDENITELLKEWQSAHDEIENTGLPQAKEKWKKFYNNTLIEAIKTAINDIRVEQINIKSNIISLNLVLKMTDYESLPDEKRYLQLKFMPAKDDRVRRFLADIKNVEGIISSVVRNLETTQAAQETISTLVPFVNSLQEDPHYRDHVTDVRNHYRFVVTSHRRTHDGHDPVMETFTGSKKDAKSSAQTTQLAYTLLASSLSYRFYFHDPARGRNTLRLIILDEFGGKFDNEKPKDILRLLKDLGFQAVLISPMTKADLLAEYVRQLIFVYKVSAKESKTSSYTIRSREDYEKILKTQTNSILSKAS